MTSTSSPLRAALLGGSAVLLLSLAGCGDDGSNFDVSSQIGPDPVLPEPSMSLVPDIKIAEVVGWQDGQTPTVPEGLTVTAYATDLVNPRTVHTLPNGDVLVVQSRGPSGKPKPRPKDYIQGWIMSLAKGGGGGPQKGSNLITLLRDTNRDGTVDE
ncbi:MAG TPA: sorbosone dehydrogenase family protein, partial [Aurantimonas coralicida]|nr:sorbosone dehydrogenase family protein [Aurantimonas coralicida]